METILLGYNFYIVLLLYANIPIKNIKLNKNAVKQKKKTCQAMIYLMAFACAVLYG